MLIDSHCHLDFDVLNEDLDAVIKRMKDAKVSGCVTISTRIEQFEKIANIAEKYENVWCSVGTHPHNAHEELHFSTKDIIELSKHPKCIAIGEVGLDYHYDNSPREAQKQGFLNHIAAARETGLPLIIHSRSADEDMIEILQNEMNTAGVSGTGAIATNGDIIRGKGAFPFILHCFSSGTKLAKVGIELGGYISFSGILTFKNATEIQNIAKFVPNNRILVETDAPYLAPAPHRGQSNEPAYVVHTAAKLAELLGISLEEAADITTNNFYRIFSKAKTS